MVRKLVKLRHVAGFVGVCATFLNFQNALAQDGPKACADQVSYLSDKDPAYKYLEVEQEKIYRYAVSADPFLREQLKGERVARTFDELKAAVFRSCSSRPDISSPCVLETALIDRLAEQIECLEIPTRFESPLFALALQLYMDELNPVVGSLFTNSNEAKFGTLPTGVFDAQAVLPPNSNASLLILNRDIFFFTGAMSKSIVDALPITQGNAVTIDFADESIRKRLAENPHIVANFADAISRLVNAGSSSGAQEVFLDYMHNLLHARLVTAMDRFLISHEQAHVSLDHVSDKTKEFRLVGGRRPPQMQSRASLNDVNSKVLVFALYGSNDEEETLLKAQVRTRKQELDADALGFRFLVEMQKAQGDPVSMWVGSAAPELIFRILEAVELYGTEAQGWTFGSANHPSANDRTIALSAEFEKLSAEIPNIGEIDFRTPFNASLRVLLEEADPLIRRNLALTANNSAAPDRHVKSSN